MLTAAALIFSYFDLFSEGSLTDLKDSYVYIVFFDNMSITISMYFLVLFYQTCKEDLAPMRPLGKFLCIKAIIFFAFWQSVFIVIIEKLGFIDDVGIWTKTDISTGLQNFLICIEMFIISISHHYAYSYKEFHNKEKRPFLTMMMSGHIQESLEPLINNMSDSINPQHDYNDTKETLTPVVKVVGKNVVNVGKNVAHVGKNVAHVGKNVAHMPISLFKKKENENE